MSFRNILFLLLLLSFQFVIIELLVTCFQEKQILDISRILKPIKTSLVFLFSKVKILWVGHEIRENLEFVSCVKKVLNSSYKEYYTHLYSLLIFSSLNFITLSNRAYCARWPGLRPCMSYSAVGRSKKLLGSNYTIHRFIHIPVSVLFYICISKILEGGNKVSMYISAKTFLPIFCLPWKPCV